MQARKQGDSKESCFSMMHRKDASRLDEDRRAENEELLSLGIF